MPHHITNKLISRFSITLWPSHHSKYNPHVLNKFEIKMNYASFKIYDIFSHNFKFSLFFPCLICAPFLLIIWIISIILYFDFLSINLKLKWSYSSFKFYDIFSHNFKFSLFVPCLICAPSHLILWIISTILSFDFWVWCVWLIFTKCIT